MTRRVLIVDDEPLARERLAGLLAQVEGFEICGEARTGREALTMAQALNPDVVLMDIRMPDMDGLAAAKAMAEQTPRPTIIITTAYEQHALEAFEAFAAGYLVKPIRRDRLAAALQMACTPSRAQAEPATLEAPTGERGHICARVGAKLELIPVDDVLYFQADQKYVTVYHTRGEVVIEDSLRRLEEDLGDRFVRVHRNALVSSRHLVGIERLRNGGHQALLTDSPRKPEVSRRHVTQVKAYLKARG